MPGTELATLIRGGTLALPDERLGIRAEPGDLLILGDRIVAAGAEVEPPEGARIIYAGGCLVIPGLVQAHAHLAQALFRGAADGLSVTRWNARVAALEAAHTAQSARAAARLAVAEMLRGGTTAVQAVEVSGHVDAVLESLAEAGMIVSCGQAIVDAPGAAPWRPQDTATVLAAAVDLAETWDGAQGGRMRILLAPHSVAACTEACLREVSQLAATGNWRVQMHAGSGWASSTDDAGDGDLDLSKIAAAGLLGPGVALAGCTGVGAAQIERLAATGTHVIHTPRSDARRGAGVAPVLDMLAAGVHVGLGSGSPAACGTLDLFREMRQVGLLQSAVQGADLLPPARLLEMATRIGAAAMGRGAEMGTLRAGSLANVALVDLRGPHGTPGQDPIATLVYRCRASDVRAVWLGGRQVVAEGRLTLWDEEEITREARREARGLLQRVAGG